MVSRRDGAEVPEPVPLGGIERGHHDRVLGRDAGGDRLADHAVDVPVLRDVLGVAVVGAEGDPTRAVLGRERKERLQVPRHRRLANQQPHTGAEPLTALVGRQALVIGANPGGRVGLQSLADEAGRVAVDMLGAFEPELLELGRQAADDARKVHHLRQAEHPVAAHQGLEIAGREGAARRLERRGGDAGGSHEVDLELEPLGGVEEPVDPVGAEHVRDLVRVGDDGGRPEWQHQAREFVDEELHRLEMHVGVDEAGHDVASSCIDFRDTVVRADAGDNAVRDRDVGVEPLPREDAEDAGRRGRRCRRARLREPLPDVSRGRPWPERNASGCAV